MENADLNKQLEEALKQLGAAQYGLERATYLKGEAMKSVQALEKQLGETQAKSAVPQADGVSE